MAMGSILGGGGGLEALKQIAGTALGTVGGLLTGETSPLQGLGNVASSLGVDGEGLAAVVSGLGSFVGGIGSMVGGIAAL